MHVGCSEHAFCMPLYCYHPPTKCVVVYKHYRCCKTPTMSRLQQCVHHLPVNVFVSLRNRWSESTCMMYLWHVHCNYFAESCNCLELPICKRVSVATAGSCISVNCCQLQLPGAVSLWTVVSCNCLELCLCKLLSVATAWSCISVNCCQL